MTDGTLISREILPPLPRKTYEEYVQIRRQFFEEETRNARDEGFEVDFFKDFQQRLLPRDEYERRIAFQDYEIVRLVYSSDGLKVVGYLFRPTHLGDAKLPLVIYTRGGTQEFGKIVPALLPWYSLLSRGYAILGTQYRGVEGGEGQEEWGGAELNDVLNLLPLADNLGGFDLENVFGYGGSRGSIMAFQALRRGFPVNAVALQAIVPDMLTPTRRTEMFERDILRPLIPRFDQRREEALRERSAIQWAEELNKPILMFHGGADWRSEPGHVLAFAQRLQALRKTYELVLYAEDDHFCSLNTRDREQRVLRWFERYTKRTPAPASA